jgi:hypothetical protein
MRGPNLDRDSIAFIVRVVVHIAEFLLVNSDVHISVAGGPNWTPVSSEAGSAPKHAFPNFIWECSEQRIFKSN